MTELFSLYYLVGVYSARAHGADGLPGGAISSTEKRTAGGSGRLPRGTRDSAP